VGTRFVAEPPKAAFDINVGYGGALLRPAVRWCAAAPLREAES
jgi:hypothetical protein